MIINYEKDKCLIIDKPEKERNYNKVISEYVKKYCLPFGYGQNVEGFGWIDRLPTDRMQLIITSSGNESKLYATIYDGDPSADTAIYTIRILDASPSAYGEVATIAGAYMETINLYMFLNDLF